MRSLLILILFSSSCALADEREECQIALVEDLAGTADLVNPAGDKSALFAGGSVQPGDLVHTAPGSWCDLRLCDGSGLRVGEDSRFYYQGADNVRESFVSWAFELARGSLRAAVVGNGKSESVKVRVRTRSAALGVRGTELVIEAEEGGRVETALHTLEGEVLMGAREDFESLATLRGSELLSHFEPVGAERMSVIRAGEAHPLKAGKFQLWEFKAGRKGLFERELHKQNANEIRARFREAQRQLQAKRAERGLFERQREKIEEKMRARPAPPVRPELAVPKKERIQEKVTRDEVSKREKREEKLEEKLRRNEEKTKNKRERKGWEQRRNLQPTSPRFPRPDSQEPR